MAHKKESMDEGAVWNRLLSGDRDALTCIYKVYVNALFNYGIKIAPDRLLVQDCIHDLFVHLWHNKDKIGETNSIKFYLYKALKRQLIRELARRNRQEANEREIKVSFNLEVVLSREMELIERQHAEDIKSNLTKAMAALTKRQQEAVYLKFYEGLTNEQIALLMALNTQSVYNIIHQSLKLLRQSCKPVASAILIILFMGLGL